MFTFVNKFRFFIQRSLLLRNLIIHSFSKMHNGQMIELGFPLTFDAIEYLMESDVTTF